MIFFSGTFSAVSSKVVTSIGRSPKIRRTLTSSVNPCSTFNVLLGSDRNFDGNNNDRPIGVGRNTGHGFDFASLDLRVSRRFRLTERVDVQLLAEGFNVLNHANFGVPNNTFGSGVNPLPTFGQPTAAFDPRQFQFGMKVNF